MRTNTNQVARHKPYITRQGCLVQRETIALPDGRIHEHITLQGVPKGMHLPRNPK